MIGFETKSDPKIAESVFLQSADMWIRTREFSGEGAWDITAGSPDTAIFTPTVAPSPAWVADELIGGKLIINGEEWAITDNSTTSITVECEGSTLVDEDYTGRIMSPARFAGLSEGKNFSDAQESIKLTDGVPRKTLRKDLIERVVTMAGSLKLNGSEEGFGIISAIFNLKDVSSATYYKGVAGSNPSPRDYYEVEYRTANVEGNIAYLRCFYGQFSPEGGEIAFDEEGYKMIPFSFEAYSDPLRLNSTVIQDDDMYEYGVEK